MHWTGPERMHRCTTNQQMQRKPTDALDQKESEDQKIVCEESDPILFPQPCRGQMIFSESTDLQDLPRNPGIEVSSRNLEPMAKTMRNPRKADARRGPRSAGRRPLTWMRNPGRDWKPQMVKEEYEELTLLTCHIYVT